MPDQSISAFPKAVELNEESLQKAISYLKQIYADIEIQVASEEFKFQEKPSIYKPEPTIEDEKVKEFVYDIFDFGDRLVASKYDETQPLDANMLKMYFTIEKMITIWSEKIKAVNDKLDEPINDWVFLIEGHELCKRKVFEVVINNLDNWVIMNFDPGNWGNTFLNGLKLLNDKQFPYPPPSPRDFYRHKLGEPSISVKFNR